MIHFIVTMLFYGAFLGILAILCMWFFLGMTVKQSIDWITQKTTEVVSVSKDTVKPVNRTPGQAADAQIKKISDMVK